MAYGIAVTSQKGGVAKTTSCISLGACLAEQGMRTLLIDLDPQANLTLATGMDSRQQSSTLADMIAHPERALRVEDLILATAQPGLSIISGSSEMADLERVLYEKPAYERTLARRLAPWLVDFEYVLIDCPPSLGSLTQMALATVDQALIPVQCDFFAAKGLDNLIEIIGAVRERVNPSLIYSVFITLFDARTTISKRILEQLSNHFGDLLLSSKINLDTRLRESPMAGEPVTLYAPRSRSSEQYRALAHEIILRKEMNHASQI